MQEVFEAVRKDMQRCAVEAGLRSFEQVYTAPSCHYYITMMSSECRPRW